MAKSAKQALYHDVEFHFLGPDEDSRLAGTVRVGDGVMMLEVREGDDPYLIEGYQNGHWYEGVNTDPQRRHNTEARWSAVGQRYVGIWSEGREDCLFTFALPADSAT